MNATSLLAIRATKSILVYPFVGIATHTIVCLLLAPTFHDGLIPMAPTLNYGLIPLIREQGAGKRNRSEQQGTATSLREDVEHAKAMAAVAADHGMPQVGMPQVGP